MSRTHLVCYAAGKDVHFLNRDRLVASAKRHHVDEIHAFDDTSIDAEFAAAHRSILDMPTGSGTGSGTAGCWLWKPYLIRKVMREVAPNDVVLYIDSGAYLRRSPEPLWLTAPDADAILFENDWVNRQYVKRDAFVLMDADVADCHDMLQVDAAMLVVRNRPSAVDFVETWLSYCCDARVVSDQPNVCGSPDLPEFVAHRHDQSVLSLLLWRERARVSHVLHRRSLKFSFIVHHRRRTARVPIWAWHLVHDGPHSIVRRVKARNDLARHWP